LIYFIKSHKKVVLNCSELPSFFQNHAKLFTVCRFHSRAHLRDSKKDDSLEINSLWNKSIHRVGKTEREGKRSEKEICPHSIISRFLDTRRYRNCRLIKQWYEGYSDRMIYIRVTYARIHEYGSCLIFMMCCQQITRKN